VALRTGISGGGGAEGAGGALVGNGVVEGGGTNGSGDGGAKPGRTGAGVGAGGLLTGERTGGVGCGLAPGAGVGAGMISGAGWPVGGIAPGVPWGFVCGPGGGPCPTLRTATGGPAGLGVGPAVEVGVALVSVPGVAVGVGLALAAGVAVGVALASVAGVARCSTARLVAIGVGPATFNSPPPEFRAIIVAEPIRNASTIAATAAPPGGIKPGEGFPPPPGGGASQRHSLSSRPRRPVFNVKGRVLGLAAGISTRSITDVILHWICGAPAPAYPGEGDACHDGKQN